MASVNTLSGLVDRTLREPIFATLALSGDLLVVRTSGHLYGLGSRQRVDAGSGLLGNSVAFVLSAAGVYAVVSRGIQARAVELRVRKAFGPQDSLLVSSRQLLSTDPTAPAYRVP